MMYSSFNEVVTDTMSGAAYDSTAFNPVENAINPADAYRQQSNLVPPVEPTATIPQQLPKQESQDGWGWKKQQAWNAKMETDMKSVKESLNRIEQRLG